MALNDNLLATDLLSLHVIIHANLLASLLMSKGPSKQAMVVPVLIWA